MDKSDVQETLVSLYLRLNGYFVSSFIVHAPKGATTEMDVLAVRFPSHQEPEREVQCCRHLAIPLNQIDFIVGEVKGGQRGAVNFNVRFRENPGAIKTVLHRFGAFDEPEIFRVMAEVPELLEPTNVRKAETFPRLDVALSKQLGSGVGKLRFVPFAAEQERPKAHTRSYLFTDDLLEFVWLCFRPEQQRRLCDDRYNYELWGPQFAQMVQYFKDQNRHAPGTIKDLYQEYGA